MKLEKINLTIGTAGHIDHGKTALVKLLTGCETDRLAAEKQRGISIELGFAPCKISDMQVGIVDVPGHENFIKTMVAGAAGMDAVMLVVAADDGVMAQTREHLDILTLLGIKDGIVALTKIDRVDEQHRQTIEAQTRNFLHGTFLQDAPICPLSNITGDGVIPFIEALDALVGRLKTKPVDGLFRLPVDRSFSAEGYGTVIAGIPASGSAKVDDTLELLPEGVTGQIRQVEVYGQTSETVQAGQCAAINMRNLGVKKIKRGQVLAQPGMFQTFRWITTQLHLLSGETVKLKNGLELKFHTGTSETVAHCYPLQESAPASDAEPYFVQFRTDDPIVVAPGDRFIIRALSPVCTIGGGTILEGTEHKLRRTRPGLIDELTNRADALQTDERFLEYALQTAPQSVMTLDEIVQATKLDPKRAKNLLAVFTEADKVTEPAPDLYAHVEVIEKLKAHFVAAVRQQHETSSLSPGLKFDELRRSLPTILPRRAMEKVIEDLLATNQLTFQSDHYALPEHNPLATSPDAAELTAIERLFEQTGFKTPSPAEVAEQLCLSPKKTDELIKTLLQHKRIVRLDGGIFMHSTAIERAHSILLDFFSNEERLESVKFKYLIDTTRKYALPLLDHFDQINVTRRVGNTRFLKQPR